MRPVGFWEAFRFWLRLGVINFGGPTGQIAIMHQELVERRRWIDEDRFLHALNYCMLLPGPEAQQLATYIGWLLHRTAGGLVAGILFVLPAALLMLILSWLYAVHGSVAWVAAVFGGLRAGVIAIVTAALLRLGARTLRTLVLAGVAAAAFLALAVFDLPFPAVVLGAGAFGFLTGRWRPASFAGGAPTSQRSGASVGSVVEDAQAANPSAGRPSLRGAIDALVIGVAAWWGPLALVAAWRGGRDVLTQEALFFSKMAMVTFGGAYAVLAYVGQAVVEQFGWLAPAEMLDGLGLAETTPGPLILVTEFVGFLAAFRHPAGLHPAVAGSLGAVVTVWATFAPSFLWIFLGAPFVERLRSYRRLAAALGAITAAVVGVMLNLLLWFALHTLFRAMTTVMVFGRPVNLPNPAAIDAPAAAVAVAAFIALWRLRWGIVPVVLGSAAAGGLVWALR
jgi:chromate transporter